jgi:hypothetical protein
MVENRLGMEYTHRMKHKCIVKCLVLCIFIFYLAPSFHFHHHRAAGSNCPLCMLFLHPLQIAVEVVCQSPEPISQTLPLLLQEQDIFFSIDRNIPSNRSPPA